MFKYLLAFCIIPFCQSVPGKVGVFHGFVLVQRWSKIAYLWQNRNLNDPSINQNAPNPGDWVLNGLWPLSRNNEIFTYGRRADGSEVTYNEADLNPDFKNSLTYKWPALLRGQTPQGLWQSQYNVYGSCISMLTSFYFETAVSLLDLHNIGDIFSDREIYPESTPRELSLFVNAIEEYFEANAYVNCLPAENSEHQYLIEVQVCFSPGKSPKYCRHRITNPEIRPCNANKLVIYE